MISQLISYLWQNKLLAAVAIYFILSITLLRVSGIDICLPCLWKSVLGFECPGCGLTTAIIHLSKLNVKAAATANPLVFIVVPAGIFFVVRDFAKFRSRHCLQH